MFVLFYEFRWECFNRIETGNSLTVEKVKAVGFRAQFVSEGRLIFVDCVVFANEARRRLKGEVGHYASPKNVLSLIKGNLNK